MTLKKCILTENDCYKKGVKMTGGKPKGIVMHSTGANNVYLKRYVQPARLDKAYDQVIKDLGVNLYGNHWNRSRGSACVHAFIGKEANGSIATYQTLPFDICCWGCGSGLKGSYNKNPNAKIQFEICEDGLKDEQYFSKVFEEAAELCAYICKEYNLSTDTICSHKEAHAAGYATNHGDPEHWLKKFGKNMDDFRGMVDEKLTGKANGSAVKVKTIFQDSNIISQRRVSQNNVSQNTEYLVRVLADVLNIRGGPGTNYKILGVIKNKGTYTIIEESDGQGASKWGRLKSGAGWVSLDFCKRVEKIL